MKSPSMQTRTGFGKRITRRPWNRGFSEKTRRNIPEPLPVSPQPRPPAGEDSSFASPHKPDKTAKSSKMSFQTLGQNGLEAESTTPEPKSRFRLAMKLISQSAPIEPENDATFHKDERVSSFSKDKERKRVRSATERSHRRSALSSQRITLSSLCDRGLGDCAPLHPSCVFGLSYLYQMEDGMSSYGW
jgi:hypothetical protein